MATPDIDEWLAQAVSGLDDDLQGRLWEHLVADGVAEAPASRASRIRQRTFDRLALPGAPRYQRLRRKGRILGLALAGAALVVAMASVPNPVSAALQRVFSFVPGIGIVHQSAKGSPVAILRQTVEGTWNGAPVQVTGVMITSSEIMVTVRGPGMTVPHQVAFHFAGGKTMTLGSSTAIGAAGSTGAQWTGIYTTMGHFGPWARHAIAGTVVIGHTHIPVTLQFAHGAQDMSVLGPTQTHHGVSLTAVVSQTGPQADLTLVPEYQRQQFNVFDVAPATVTPAGVPSRPGISIVDSTGHRYAVSRIMTVGPDNQFRFMPKTGVRRYDVTVPQVDAQYPGQAQITVPVPTSGTRVLDRTVNLGGFPVEITTLERVSGASGPALRLGLNLHVSSGKARALHSFWVHQNFEAKVNPATGALKSMTVAIKPDQRSLTLRLWHPDVYIRGPWTFSIQLPGAGAAKPGS